MVQYLVYEEESQVEESEDEQQDGAEHQASDSSSSEDEVEETPEPTKHHGKHVRYVDVNVCTNNLGGERICIICQLGHLERRTQIIRRRTGRTRRERTQRRLKKKIRRRSPIPLDTRKKKALSLIRISSNSIVP